MPKQTPRIVFSALGKRWYVVTRFSMREGIDGTTGEKHQYMVASVKYDVTDQMAAILKTRTLPSVRPLRTGKR